MIEVLALVLMAALSGAAFVFHERERRTWDTERRTLLDRIQAPSFHELKSYGGAPIPRPQMFLSDADEADIAARTTESA